jgi:exosome complex RNA-binding protein Rrp42 (RNase PH superfamily)
MSEAYLSEYEKTFLLYGVQDGHRLDGRNCDDYRPVSVVYDYVTNSYGSCQLRLGETKVIATVKAEIGSPNPATPNNGSINFFVDW